MYSLSDTSIIMATDETLVCRPFSGATLGSGVNVVGGKRVYDPVATFEFYGNVQPVTGKDLILLPEGDRFDEQLYVWIPENQPQVPDTNDYVYRDSWYQVQDTETWGNYRKCRIQRIDVGPDRARGV